MDVKYTGEQRTVTQVLADQVERAPDRVLLRTADKALDRREVDRQSTDLACRFREVGVGSGDHVLLMLENSELYIFAWFALAKLGAVEVPVNPALKGQTLIHIVKTSGAKVILTDAQFLPPIQQVTDGLETLKTVLIPGSSDARGLAGLDLVGLDDLPVGSLIPQSPGYSDEMALMFTSGTTGPAKGVMVTHAHAYEYANSVRTALELTANDIYYAPLPLFHIAGQWAVVYAALMSGGSAVIRKKFSVSGFWDDVADSGATVSFLLGAMANLLYGRPEDEGDSDTSLDRLLMTPLIPDLDGFRTRFGVKVATAYGSTECNVSIHSDFSIDDPQSCGRARPGWDVAILDQNDERLGPGKTGQIAVRPPEPWLTMKGYLGNPEATAAAYQNCWLHTGDIAYRDDEGNFYFVDRANDAIRRRGENISSFEVEREVNSHPGVLESAAVGVPSEHTEEEVLIQVVVQPGVKLEASELHAYLRERAPRFMVPRYIALVDGLPKTETGKIQKAMIREAGTSGCWEAPHPRSPSK